MTITANEFERLGTVAGFNNAVLHCKSLIGMLGDIGGFVNLADILNREVADGTISVNQVNPIIAALLKDKFSYSFTSHNLLHNFSNFADLQETVGKWKALDLVLVYHHPELGIIAINPKNPKSFEGVNLFKKDEILVIYAGAFGTDFDRKLALEAIGVIEDLVNGKKGKKVSALEKGKYGFSPIKEPKPQQAAPAKAAKAAGPGRKKTNVVVTDVKPEKQKAYVQAQEPAPQAPPPPPASTGRKTMTPMYSVPVTNELFHNGNVEAWKKVITSYTTKYPGSEVYIFYEGERIHDINTLFKWGKVKHGSSIMFAVAGEEIRDVAKLQRYLRQGASPRFEDFLRFPVNSVLKLF